MPSRWRTNPMVARCEAIKRSSVLSSARRCELDANHDGPHMAGLSEGENLVSVWSTTRQRLLDVYRSGSCGVVLGE